MNYSATHPNYCPLEASSYKDGQIRLIETNTDHAEISLSWTSDPSVVQYMGADFDQPTKEKENVIPDPEHLRRYYGISLCNVCFGPHHQQDQVNEGSVDHYSLPLTQEDKDRLAKDYERINKDPVTIAARMYWNRVAKLVF